MEAEIEVTLPKTRKCQGLPAPIEARRNAWDSYSLSFQKEPTLTD